MIEDTFGNKGCTTTGEKLVFSGEYPLYFFVKFFGDFPLSRVILERFDHIMSPIVTEDRKGHTVPKIKLKMLTN